MRLLARPIVAALFLGVLFIGCGDSGDGSAVVSTTSNVPALSTLAEWCSTFGESLPALSSPNPAGRELEVLDVYVARYDLLALGAPGVPESAKGAMGQLSGAIAAVRDRVADGEQLPVVLAEAFADDQSDLLLAAAAADVEAAAVCS